MCEHKMVQLSMHKSVKSNEVIPTKQHCFIKKIAYIFKVLVNFFFFFGGNLIIYLSSREVSFPDTALLKSSADGVKV